MSSLSPNGDRVRAALKARLADTHERLRYQEYRRMLQDIGVEPMDYQQYLKIRERLLKLFSQVELDESPLSEEYLIQKLLSDELPEKPENKA